jgi:septal ring factor EnvC (AmiA/AmiB activator)
LRSWPAVAALIVAALTASAASAAGPKDAERRLQDLEQAIEKDRQRKEKLEARATQLQRDLNSLRAESVAAATAMRTYEGEILHLEDRLAELAAVEVDTKQLLAEKRSQAGRATMALQRIARHPPEALIAQPISPSDMVRSAILLRAAVPAIEQRAARLKQDLNRLALAREEMKSRRLELAAAVEGLAKERQRLSVLVERKSALQRQVTGESAEAERRLQAMADEAASLLDLLTRLEEERQARAAEETRRRANKPEATTSTVARAPNARLAPGSSRPITSARGRLPFPVIGRLAGRYGQPTETGLTRKGIAIEASPDATVIAPYDGYVVFAGKFRGYGQLLIIEHSEGYHTLLAGMARIDCVIGQWVTAGEPVGAMGRPADNGKPTLYVELRRNGQPINPLPWLAASKDKVSG